MALWKFEHFPDVYDGVSGYVIITHHRIYSAESLILFCMFDVLADVTAEGAFLSSYVLKCVILLITVGNNCVFR